MTSKGKKWSISTTETYSWLMNLIVRAVLIHCWNSDKLFKFQRILSNNLLVNLSFSSSLCLAFLLFPYYWDPVNMQHRIRFKIYNDWFDTFIYRNIIIAMVLVSLWSPLFIFVWWEHLRSSLLTFAVNNSILLTISTMLYIRSLELISQLQVCTP